MNKLFLSLIVSLVLVGCNPTPESSSPERKEVSLEEQVENAVRRDWVNDQAKLFTNSQYTVLRRKLQDFAKSDETKPQLIVLTVESLGGQNIEEFASAFFKRMKIGNKKHDNGMLLVIAKNDRKLRIEVGYGLEGKIPDSAANKIIRERMIPNLQKGSEKWYVAVDSAVTELIYLARKE